MGAFVFWGLFVAATLIVVAYTVWMVAAERAADADAGTGPGEGSGAP